MYCVAVCPAPAPPGSQEVRPRPLASLALCQLPGPTAAPSAVTAPVMASPPQTALRRRRLHMVSRGLGWGACLGSSSGGGSGSIPPCTPPPQQQQQQALPRAQLAALARRCGDASELLRPVYTAADVVERVRRVGFCVLADVVPPRVVQRVAASVLEAVRRLLVLSFSVSILECTSEAAAAC
jgi:hypothetical protein